MRRLHAHWHILTYNGAEIQNHKDIVCNCETSNKQTIRKVFWSSNSQIKLIPKIYYNQNVAFAYLGFININAFFNQSSKTIKNN